MRRIAEFQKVSREKFVSSMKEDFPQYTEKDIEDMYDSIILRHHTIMS